MYKLNPEDEEYFENYLRRLNSEVVDLSTIFELWIHIQNRREDRLDELNISPTFFGMTLESMLTTIIISIARLYDGNRSERNLIRFINYCEQHLDLFSTESMKIRRTFPDNHWFLKQHKPITLETISDHKNSIQEKKLTIESLFKWRDQKYAHLDKKYFDSSLKLEEDAPLKIGEIRSLVEIAQNILNRFSGAFNGNIRKFDAVNLYDIDNILEILHKHRETLKSQFDN